jgi:hypothetical protein
MAVIASADCPGSCVEDRHGDTYPDLPWEPKAAFTAVADFCRTH